MIKYFNVIVFDLVIPDTSQQSTIGLECPIPEENLRLMNSVSFITDFRFYIFMGKFL